MKSIKVEINGLNTSELPVYSSKKQMEILNRIRKGEQQLKDDFINANLRLVLSIVKKFNNRGENVDDIFQVGVVGLIKAMDNFDLSQNVQFSTYAVPMIIGEIRRFLREQSTMRVSRAIRDMSYKVSKEREKYLAIHEQEPTISFLAKELNTSEEEIVLAMDSVVQPMSIYDSVYTNDGKDSIYIVDQIKSEEKNAEDMTEKLALFQALDKLSEKEKQIIKRRYFDEATQTEIAEEIGVSQAQVSRIEKAAIERIKRKMQF